jgi:hypothetical protein
MLSLCVSLPIESACADIAPCLFCCYATEGSFIQITDIDDIIREALAIKDPVPPQGFPRFFKWFNSLFKCHPDDKPNWIDHQIARFSLRFPQMYGIYFFLLD